MTITAGSRLVFQGETAITIDDKGRLAIPTSQREALACLEDKRLVVTYNPFESDCLWIFPYPTWDAIRNSVNTLPLTTKKRRKLRLKLVAAASSPAEPDGNGRISIPATMRAALKIERKAVLLGNGDRFELWSEAGHLAQIQETLDDIEPGDLPEGILL